MDQDLAILQLLGDDDPATVALVRSKLAEVKSPDELRTLHARAEGAAASHLQALLREVGLKHAEEAFSHLCTGFKEEGDLEEANWLLAAVFLPGEDLRPQRRLLDEWGVELTGRLAGIPTAGTRVDVLVHYLGQELRLRGNDADYYNLSNSLLPRVIDSRLGIPISLSLVYLLVARRANLDVEGVGLPGHFVARYEDIFFDPFHGGRRLGLEECAAMLQRQNLTLMPQHLRPATPRQMLLRTLTNLYYIAEQSNPALAMKISQWAEKLKGKDEG